MVQARLPLRTAGDGPHENKTVRQGQLGPIQQAGSASTILYVQRHAGNRATGFLTWAGKPCSDADTSPSDAHAEDGTTYPVQRIMALAEFQNLTPGSLTKPRSAVALIDGALRTYIQTRTGANAGTLVGIIRNYVLGNHDATRKDVARDLLRRADAERRILLEIGDPNAFLVDGLIDQSGGRIDQLVQLAHDATVANAAVLPQLISTVGETNLTNLIHSNLVALMGPAHVPLLPPMIVQSGGIAARADLANIVNRHANAGDRAFDLTREANGNAAEFHRLATEVPLFHQTAAPVAVPAGVTAAVAAYNAARAPALAAALAALVAQANIAHNQATALGGVPVGLMNSATARIATVNTHVVGPGIPANVVNDAQQARNIICGALTNAVTTRAGVLGVPVPAAFTAAAAAVDAANTAAAGAHGAAHIASVSWPHFLSRHTAEYFNFAEVKPDNTQWNTAWGAASPNNVETNLVGVLAGLSAAGRWLQAGVAIPNQPCPLGGSAQIASLAVAAGGLNVGMFFPEHTPAAQIFDHSGSTMRAIERVI